jgi:chromosome segregation ATPase
MRAQLAETRQQVARGLAAEAVFEDVDLRARTRELERLLAEANAGKGQLERDLEAKDMEIRRLRAALEEINRKFEEATALLRDAYEFSTAWAQLEDEHAQLAEDLPWLAKHIDFVSTRSHDREEFPALLAPFYMVFM